MRSLKNTLYIAGITVCLLLAPLAIMNATIAVKSFLHPDVVPDFFGIKPFIIVTDSMAPTIDAGDLVVSRVVAPSSLAEGDIISFKVGNSVVTHRIIEVAERNGEPAFVTKGDAMDAEDSWSVSHGQVEGVFLFRIAKLGSIALFAQTPLGLLVFIGIPVAGFCAYDIIRHRLAKQAKTKRQVNQRKDKHYGSSRSATQQPR